MSLLTVGRTASCSTANCSGGTTGVWLANFADLDSVTEDGSGNITAFTMVATKTFYKYSFAAETAEFRETVTVENCSVLVESILEMAWKCVGQDDRNIIMDIANNCCGMIVIAKQATGKFWVFGHTDEIMAAKLTSSEFTGGKAFSDGTQDVLTLTCRSNVKAVEYTGLEASIPV